MSRAAEAVTWFRGRQGACLERLVEFLRIPSVSTSPERVPDMARAAAWVAVQLRALGFPRVEVLPTARHPVVYGEQLGAGPGAPTVLFYGHYDVQPAEPLEKWASGPFEPAVRGDALFARGASDMKGGVCCFLNAIEALVRTGGGKLPVNLKVMIEGEEEIGSPSLPGFLKEQKARLACDLCLNGDGGILAPDAPAITYALRGLAYFEVRLTGPAQDLHSGIFGGAIENPANVLARLIAGMHDAAGRVTLPGFYDRVRQLSAEERAEFARLPMSEAWWKEKSGAPALAGEAGYSATERATARPTLDVNGLWSGFTGAGSKTVLPAQAAAKISMRLVPDQDPEEVRRGLEEYLRRQAPPTVKWELSMHSGVRAPLVERDSRGVRAAQAALRAVWDREPFFARGGGTIPVVSLIKDLLGVDSLLLGFGLPDDNLHAPNEKLHLPTWHKGTEAFIHFLELYAG